MAVTVPQKVVDAAMASISRPYSRLEIYERDGVTRFMPDDQDRLIDGSVTIDQTRDERYAFDVVLDNSDDGLTVDPESIWYDKILKIFKGLYIDRPNFDMDIAIAEGSAAEQEVVFQLLSRTGFAKVLKFGDAVSVAQLIDFDVVIGLGGTDEMSKPGLYIALRALGVNVFTVSTGTTQATVPLISTAAALASTGPWGISPDSSGNGDLTFGWERYVFSTPANSKQISTVFSGVAIAAKEDSGRPILLTSKDTNSSQSRWVHLQAPLPALTDDNEDFEVLLDAIMIWLNPDNKITQWETQVGEYEIDSISQDHFPHQMSLSGRDRTKTCMGSQLEAATSYAVGTQVGTAVRSLAANAGITKFVFPPSTPALTAILTYEAGQTRWEVMKALAGSISYDLYFDGRGRLTLQPFKLPDTSPVSAVFQTGPSIGNLVTYTKANNDSEIFNVILVSSQSSDDTVPPITARASNDDPNSPTSTVRIGTRAKRIDDAVVTTQAQAQTMADTMLSVSTLQSYNINFAALQFFWLEAGDIVQFLDPRRTATEPTRFLLDTMDLPLGLGTMGATSKRLQIVG
jgi:hypothetical protein